MRPDQTRRAVILLSLFLALAVGARHFLKRGVVHPPSTVTQSTTIAVPEIEDQALARGVRSALVRLARQVLDGGATTALAETDAPTTVLVSLPRTQKTALVVRSQGQTPAAAVTAAVTQLRRRATDREKRDGRLKLDLVSTLSRAKTFDGKSLALERSLQGLWLPEIDVMLLPEELEARRLVDSDGDLRLSRLAAYLAEGGRDGIPDSLVASDRLEAMISTYHTVTFDSLAEGPRYADDEAPPIRLFRGNDRAPDLSPEALLAAARFGGDYLRSHLEDDGSFVYAYDPKRHREDDDDNLLRRAGTCYSLVQLHRAVSEEASTTSESSPSYLEVARRGLAALLDQYTQEIPLPGMGDGVEALVSPGDELKLGGSALLLLALMEYQEVSGDLRWLPRGQSLARFLVAQQEADGHFISKISLQGKRFNFESGYYPGEAILALTRLYEADGDRRWLEVASHGANWLINVRDAGKATAELAHDHWLLMGLEALYRLQQDAAHAAHAGRIAQAIVEAQRLEARHLDWLGSFYDPPRSTPTATRAEALVAMVDLTRITGQDSRPFVEALMRMAAFQRRCQFDQVSAMYLQRPDLAIGGFRRSLTHYEIRIDYVQHNISALLGLRQILRSSS